MSLRMLIAGVIVCIACWPGVAVAAVELSLQGRQPQLINDVYHQDNVPYLAIDDVLPALGLSGYWDSVAHLYRMRTARGRATFFPGGQYLKVGERFYQLAHRPRFIDGRLRVSEDFVLEQLADLVSTPIYYRNLNPVTAAQDDDGVLDKLFAFLLQKKRNSNESSLRAVAIDPAHGGEDTGTIGIGGIKEKNVVLAVASSLQKQLKMQLGIPVYLSRDEDYALTLEQHLASARHDDVDAFLLLHAQSSFSPVARGIHLYVRPAKDELNGNKNFSQSSIMLALQLSSALRAAGFDVVEVAHAPLVPLMRGNLPTVLVELGYLSNKDDQALLTSSAGQQRLAAALYAGLREFSRAVKE
ncbi:MAG: N-acetylmuramoyl-L-alanine amidase [Desulfuromonas sp.]|nr:N-acetylmuramoyl-L-alanine amidase [Desulfuromonas sp.]